MDAEAASVHLINYDSPGKLRSFLDNNGLGMRKKYGQNFLINPAARLKLLDALEPDMGDHVWEIGPGLGAMTRGLLERGAHVTAFEIDPAFSRILKELFCRSETFCPGSSFRLVEGDVLKTWPSAEADEKTSLLGNLPYNIAAALLADFTEKGRFFKRMVVTVQREVAERMASGPGSADYSSFSVLCASAYKVSLLSVIKSSSFYPEPNVDSRGVRLDLLPEREKRPALFYPMVRGLFSGRRKTIRNTLSAFAASVIIKPGSQKEIAEEVFRKSGVSGDRRPETLGINEFNVLALNLEELVRNV